MLSATKEGLLKLLSSTLDGHATLKQHPAEYCDGIKHVRELFDHRFGDHIDAEELLEFCVGIICSVQPEEPRLNRYLTHLEQGMLAAAYFLYTALHPIEYIPARGE